MRRSAVGLYCAVVEWFDLLVSMRTCCRTRNAGALKPAGREPAQRFGVLNLGLGEGPQKALRRVIRKRSLNSDRNNGHVRGSGSTRPCPNNGDHPNTDSHANQ
jgi:hypothetical protein